MYTPKKYYIRIHTLHTYTNIHTYIQTNINICVHNVYNLQVEAFMAPYDEDVYAQKTASAGMYKFSIQPFLVLVYTRIDTQILNIQNLSPSPLPFVPLPVMMI